MAKAPRTVALAISFKAALAEQLAAAYPHAVVEARTSVKVALAPAPVVEAAEEPAGRVAAQALASRQLRN